MKYTTPEELATIAHLVTIEEAIYQYMEHDEEFPVSGDHTDHDYKLANYLLIALWR